jgi:hypothetical protein
VRPTWELTGFNTDARHRDDVRYRAYTSSRAVAERFERIPKIQFSDSGHGIVFSAREMKSGERRRELRRGVVDYVQRHLGEIERKEREERAARPSPTARLRNLAAVVDLVAASLERKAEQAPYEVRSLYLDDARRLREALREAR